METEAILNSRRPEISTVVKALFSVMLIFTVSCSFVMILPVVSTGMSEPAYAAIKVGDSEIQGYEPTDVVSTDESYQIDADGATTKLEGVVIKLVKIAMPFLMIACVAIIAFNACRNIFRKPEDRVPMGDLIKNMFVNFFFILFAWIIVEGIVFIVTSGETILFSTILS